MGLIWPKKCHSVSFFALALTILFPVGTFGQPGDGLLGFVTRIGRRIDTAAVSGVDSRYITAPRQPWQITIKSSLAQTDMKMQSDIDGSAFFEGVVGNLHWEPRIRTELSSYVGLWAGYRGYGVGYSKNVKGDGGSYLTFGATGSTYGVNLRIHRFSNDEPEVFYNGYFPDYREQTMSYHLESPIKTHTLILDGYYLFNGKHFSYTAAYDQSNIQLRSAGSLMAGAMYYYSNIHYDADRNADLILLMDDIGRIRQWEASVGVGYAYNFVPARGWLLSAMAMPMVSFLNKLKTYHYDSNYRQLAIDDVVHDEDELPVDEYRIWPMYEKTRHSRMVLNFDARLSLTYNWNCCFFNVYGQLNRFRFQHEHISGRLTDWFVNAQVGVRL